MKVYENLVESFKSTSKIDFTAMYSEVEKAIKSGEVMNDPNMLLALALFATAGIILLVCIIAFFVRKPSGSLLDESSSNILDSRIQALEVALMDHRNLAISLKNQSKADFAYFKQEMKNLHLALEELSAESAMMPAPRRLRKASNA